MANLRHCVLFMYLTACPLASSILSISEAIVCWFTSVMLNEQIQYYMNAYNACCHHHQIHQSNFRCRRRSLSARGSQSNICNFFFFIQMKSIFGIDFFYFEPSVIYNRIAAIKLAQITESAMHNIFLLFVFENDGSNKCESFFLLLIHLVSLFFFDILQTTKYHHFYWFWLVFCVLPIFLYFSTFNHASYLIEWTEFLAN